MKRDPRYDILFEPVQIGPVTAKNRFYQVPHCTGMGFAWPNASNRFREIKAEGGWGVVCTEECSVHPSSDHWPSPYLRLWDDDDVAPLAHMVELVHRHGALAGLELGHSGSTSPNRLTREGLLAPSAMPLDRYDPLSARAMSKADIRDLRRWHLAAARRAKQADFDIVYVYCSQEYSIPMQFLSRRHNKRGDEYGGSLENRARLVRELLEDMKDAIGDRCAVAIRFHVEEFLGPAGMTHDGEARDVVELLAELPDLWDINLSDWPHDSGASRFFPESYQRPYVEFVKSVTSKPVVGVGRFTSPDTMVSQIRKGVLDLIGAARPSIADPFLPKKIEEGRPEDIRECIGCNICASGENTSTPMRCTQNPTVGEEWRRDWHPETVPAKGSDDPVLIIGAGPAGLECAVTLGKRGYRVLLAESTRQLGGRVVRERKLPGLSEWGRVADHRIQQLQELANVEVYLESHLDSGHVLEFGVPHVVIANGSIWRRDGTGRANLRAVPGCDSGNILTPDDIMSGTVVDGPVVIFDDDHYYMGSAIAEVLAIQGSKVTFVTPAVEAASWTRNTLEWMHIQKRFADLGIEVVVHHNLERLTPDGAKIASMVTGQSHEIECAAVVMVTARDALDQLYEALIGSSERFSSAGIKSVERIGDCLSPGTIAATVFDGHRYARELDSPSNTDMPYRSERVLLVT